MPLNCSSAPAPDPRWVCRTSAAATNMSDQQYQQHHPPMPSPADSSNDNGISRKCRQGQPPWRTSSCSSRTAAATLALLLLLPSLLVRFVDARAAQPCIECSQCLTASCQRICSNSCGPRGRASLTSGQCKQQGEDAADAVADAACRAVQGACQAGTKSAMAFASSAPVSASECASIANGACQRSALSSTNTPCGVYLYFGFRSCSGRQFNDMYKARVIALCRGGSKRRQLL